MPIEKLTTSIFFWLVLTGNHCSAAEFNLSGRVIYVIDGDTLTLLLNNNEKIAVRLSDIDAPETSHGRNKPGQPYSQISKKSLSALAKGEQSTARCYEWDKWNRPVCTVYVNGIDLNAEQLRKGMAWVNHANKRYVRDSRSYELEAQAKTAGLGLWAFKGETVAPWAWRKDCWQLSVCANPSD